MALIAAAGALAIAFGSMTVMPAQAVESVTTIDVAAGTKVTRDIGNIPAGATSMDVMMDTLAVGRTDLKLLIGPEYTQRYYFTAPAGDGPERYFTVPVTSVTDGTIAVWSSVANVRVVLTVLGFTGSSVPSASNTGVPAGTVLKVVNGDINVTVAGTVLNGLDVRGLVKIDAANVTIKNSIIRGRTMNGPGALINNLGGYSGLVITDTELFPTVASPHANGIYGYNFTATRLNIHNVIDGIHITGSNVLVEKTWVHDHVHYLSDPNQGGTPSHDDSIQIQVGNNIKIIGNHLTGSYSAAVQITQDRGKVSNFVYTGNYANNGKCTVNIAEKTYGPILGGVVKDNTFGHDTRLENCAVIVPDTTKLDLARNFFVPENVPITVRRG